MAKPTERLPVKFYLKPEIIAALKIAAALKQVDTRDVLEELVEKNLSEFVALAIKKKT